MFIFSESNVDFMADCLTGQSSGTECTSQCIDCIPSTDDPEDDP